MSIDKNQDIDIIELDPLKVTFKQALELSDIELDAFARDPLFHIKTGPDYVFPDRPIAPEDQTRYNKLVYVNAWQGWSKFLDVNNRVFVALKRGKPVGYCRWATPEFAQKTAPLYHKIKIMLFDYWAKLVELWVFGWTSNSPATEPPEMEEYFESIEQEAGVERENEAAYRKSLAHFTAEALATTPYLKSDYNWCSFMCVRMELHGQGVGKLLFSKAIEEIPPYAPKFTDNETTIQGPAKYGLFGSPMGSHLYRRFGFRQVSLHQALIHGHVIETTFMEMIAE